MEAPKIVDDDDDDEVLVDEGDIDEAEGQIW